jgi:hypothetical protein
MCQAAFLAYIATFRDGLIVADFTSHPLYHSRHDVHDHIAPVAGWGSKQIRPARRYAFSRPGGVVWCVDPDSRLPSLSMVEIVVAGRARHLQLVLLPPAVRRSSLPIYIAATAEANRTPSGIPEAEQELRPGSTSENSGMKFAMFFLAEFVNMFTVSAIAVTLFFGGWNGPFLPSWVWFLLKTLGVVFLLMMFRWTYPRLRVDQLMEFAWKFLVPVTFGNLILAALMKQLGWYW